MYGCWMHVHIRGVECFLFQCRWSDLLEQRTNVPYKIKLTNTDIKPNPGEVELFHFIIKSWKDKKARITYLIEELQLQNIAGKDYIEAYCWVWYRWGLNRSNNFPLVAWFYSLCWPRIRIQSQLLKTLQTLHKYLPIFTCILRNNEMGTALVSVYTYKLRNITMVQGRWTRSHVFMCCSPGYDYNSCTCRPIRGLWKWFSSSSYTSFRCWTSTSHQYL